ncbi:MAG: hypothetical protein KC668_26525 [Myxococcales bacterium]|nr:hypothetical protein [Myxococcales bacterium]
MPVSPRVAARRLSSHPRRRVLATFAFAALACQLLGGSSASAGGLEWPGLGTRGAGRAGAWRARTDTALALHLNPANLARLSGTQLELTLHLSTFHACFDRTGTPTQDADGNPRVPMTPTPNDTVFGTEDEYGDVAYPRVCNDRGLFPLPQAGVSFRPHQRVGVGIGLIAPNSGQGVTTFGDADGTMAAPLAPTGRLPTSTRYDLIEANLLLAFVTAGIGVALHPRLRVGATFGWGFANIRYSTVTAPLAGESAVFDILADLSVHDRFVPRVSGSIAAEPVDGLDIMLGYTWIDVVRATGDLRLRSFHYATEETIQALNPRFGSTRTDRTLGASLDAPQASTLSFATRWAMRRDGAVGVGGAGRDPMTDEVFDLELDVDVSLGNVVDAFQVGPHGTGDPENRLDTGVAGVTIYNAPELELVQNWKTQTSVMLGGDYNVVPGRFALRMGLSYENDGIKPGSERLGFVPWSRMSFGLGATLRVERMELSLAYQHIHWFRRNTTEQEAAIRQATLTGGNIQNAGSYTASADIVSLSLAYRFHARVP